MDKEKGFSIILSRRLYWTEEIEHKSGVMAVVSVMDSKVPMTICCLCVCWSLVTKCRYKVRWQLHYK